MSACLIFECSQVVLLRRQLAQKATRFRHICQWIYWTVIVLTTFIASVGWAISGKQDAAAVQFIAFFGGMMGITLLLYQDPSHFEQSILPRSRWYLKIARGFNCFFKIIHAAFSIFFAAGAITLTSQFQHENPYLKPLQ
jgi:hypothetical protein